MDSKVHIQQLPIPGKIELVQATYVRMTIPRHVHTSYGIGLIEAGARRTFIRGRWELIPAGQVMVINPGEAHTCAPADDSGQSYRMFCVPVDFMTRLDLLEKGGNSPFFPRTVINDNRLFADLRRFADQVTNTLPLLEIETSLQNLLTCLILRYAQEPPALSLPVVSLNSISRLREFIDAHYNHEIGIDALSAVASLSPFHLVRLFTKYVGIPPHTYQTLTRLRQARKLLWEGIPIADTAIQTGFFDQSHLTNVFKKYVGVTPGQFIQMCDGRHVHSGKS
jgi:AraC-like DNA-binding protein